MATTSSARDRADTQGVGSHLGVAQSVFGIAELMVVLDATVLGIALADPGAGPESVTDRSTPVDSLLGT